ncbi:MAG: hypothetical protein QY327_05540 [Fimbriimonadaceae bacterium]|uniref:Uncharacterized protein n=1 Tax=Candidatus Nitrosymbiomonas proteolyticus TaxID=2608984 RepID=A0A809S205_9BACT|nr:MAG: hypothetical protein QY327_05540 [Fimbriimonadaceae bacterium]BBO22587.1 conserved hypothetical protein [Candidatus Nitrosymbiomonas proteolyticus]
MRTADNEITKAVEAIQNDQALESEFQAAAGSMEDFYQRMLAAGIARKEDYNIVATGEASHLDVSFLIRT